MQQQSEGWKQDPAEIHTTTRGPGRSAYTTTGPKDRLQAAVVKLTPPLMYNQEAWSSYRY